MVINVLMLKELRKKQKVSQQKLATKLGVSRSTVAMWEIGASQPDNNMLLQIASYFNVSIDYLLGNETATATNSTDDGLTEHDNRDIAKDLDNIMEKLSKEEAGPASYNGEDLDPEAAELFREELKIALKRLKLINKEKYTPKKYKK